MGGEADGVRDELALWRESLLTWLLRVTAGLAIPLGALLGWFHAHQGRHPAAWISMGCSLLVALVALVPRDRVQLRLHGYLTYLGITAALSFLTAGPLGVPMGLFLALVTFAVMLSGWRVAVAYGGGVTLTFCGSAYLHVSGTLPIPPPVYDITAPGTWAVGGLAALVVVAVIAGSHRFLVDRLAGSLQQARELNEALTRESGAREQASRALMEAQEEALHAERLKVVGQMASGITHDLNNALAAIMCAADMSSDQVAADRVITAATQASGLTRRLLTLGRRDVLVRRSVDLEQLITDVSPTLENAVPSDIQLELDLAADHSGVHADPVELQQVLFNLVLNARDALPEGGHITVRTVREEDGPWVRWQVQDDGVGMDAERQAQVFEPFFTTKPAGRGTGLGLSNTRRIVSELGGEIELESAPGQGATFTLRLPRTAQLPSDAPEAAPLLGHGERVLLVDDDIAVRAGLAGMLERAGYRVTEARNGQQALAVAESHPPDLLITDVAMPLMSGPELIHCVRERNPGLPVLVYSGYAAADELHSVLATPCAHLLRKPAPRDVILQAVATLLSECGAQPVRRRGESAEPRDA